MSTHSSQTGRLPSQYLLKQRYIIIGQAGKGGMGAVYRAVDTQQGQRQVAVKELSQAHLNETELKEVTARFQQEAAMLAALSHPNLPRILDAFSEEGRSYLVMDFIEGQTLQQMLRDAKQPLPVPQVLHYARQLCDVLSYLHQQNPPIIFRDVKPTNIMITPNGHVFLIDFGIARFFKEGQTQDTIFLGSPGYAPPEQHGLSQTNQQSDIYGLGATLHYCLTGIDPYYVKARFSFPPVHTKNPSVPPELDQLVQRMVAYQAPQRPTSAREVQQILTRISQQAAEHTSGLRPDSVPASAPTQYTPPLANTVPSFNIQQSAHIAPTVAVQPPTTPQLSTTSPSNRGTMPVASPPGPHALTTARPLWTKPFMALLIALLVLTIGSSLVVIGMFFSVPYGYAFILEASFLLLLAIVAGIGSTMIQRAGPKGIFLVTGIVALIAGFAALSLGSLDVQNAIAALIKVPVLSQLLTYGLAAITIASFLWLLRPFSLMLRVVMAVAFGITAICTFAQATAANDSTIKHIFLLVALIAVIVGTVVTIQTERSAQR